MSRDFNLKSSYFNLNSFYFNLRVKRCSYIGVTLDRQLHVGEHCARLRRKVKPRIAQLRKLAGRSWGLEEPQLRTIANGYVRGRCVAPGGFGVPCRATGAGDARAAARVVTR